MKSVVFIGGSITEGAGAVKIKNNYVSIVSEYLKDIYNDVNIINLGAGGTASDFALFRIKKQLKGKSPDIVFLEFSVNDRIYPINDIVIYFEGLIREIIKINKECKIIALGMPTKMSDACVSIHKKICYNYNIPFIDIQDFIWYKIGQGEYIWQDISIDDLHPNDMGHKVYGQRIIEELNKINIENIQVKEGGNLISGYKFNKPSIKEYSECIFYGNWQEVRVDLNNKFDLAAVTNIVGDAIEVNFTGRNLAMMNVFSKDSGILECLLDNKYMFEVDLYMDIDKRFEKTINLLNLDDREHNLIMKVSEKKNPNSLGNKITIGGFLVEGEKGYK